MDCNSYSFQSTCLHFQMSVRILIAGCGSTSAFLFYYFEFFGIIITELETFEVARMKFLLPRALSWFSLSSAILSLAALLLSG